MKEVVERIKERFSITAETYQRDDLTLCTAEKAELVPLLRHMRDEEGYRHLVLLTAVDYIEQGVFQLTYIIHNYEMKHDLALRVEIDRENPVMQSAHDLWETIATYQRELREMFGIDFPDSPGVNDDFILEGWEGIPPYRRDFDTKKYAEETFFPRPGRVTHDPKERMKGRVYKAWEENQDV